MALDISEIHHFVEVPVNACSILLNCYLLYLIKYHSTFGVKLYQYMLIVDVFLDLCLSVTAFLCQPVSLTVDGYVAIISHGFFSGRSPSLDSNLVFVLFLVLHMNIMWIPVQFVFRYRLLCKNNTKSMQANFTIAAVTIVYSIIAFLVIKYTCEVRDENQHIGQRVFEMNNWPLQDKKQLNAMVSHVTEFRLISWTILWSFTSSVSIVIVVWCEKTISKHFRQMGNPTHLTTQRMHKEFHRALLAMAICPLITTAVPTLYFCTIIVLQLCPGWISVFMTIAASSISLFNPLTTIVCFRCYRIAALKLITFNLCDKKVQQVDTLASLPSRADATTLAPQQTSSRVQ